MGDLVKTCMESSWRFGPGASVPEPTSTVEDAGAFGYLYSQSNLRLYFAYHLDGGGRKTEVVGNLTRYHYRWRLQ